MVNDDILRIFEEHIKKYETLGNGNFGTREAFLDSELQIYATDDENGGLIFQSPKFAHNLDCGGAAFVLSRDLREKGFLTKEKYAMNDGYQQNYVEVFDPESCKWLQLDATPWYRRITDHKEAGEYAEREINLENKFITPEIGQFLSTKRQDDGSFVDVYIAGGYFSLNQLRAQMQRQIRTGKNVPQSPHYSFTLWARQSHDGITTSAAYLTWDVMDSRKLDNTWIDASYPSVMLEKLIKSGAAQVKIEGVTDRRTNEMLREADLDEVAGKNTIDFNYAAAVSTPETALRLLYHVPVLANIALRLERLLKTRKGKVIDVSTGTIHDYGLMQERCIEFEPTQLKDIVSREFKIKQIKTTDLYKITSTSSSTPQ